MFSVLHFRAIQLCVTLGLILSIVGGTSSVSSTGVYSVQTTSKAGVCLYILAYIALVFVTVISVSKIGYVSSGESRLVWAVVIAMPFILVRLIYSLLTVFHHDKHFSTFSGSVVILVVMAILEEMFVVLVYLLAGFLTDAAPKSASRPIQNRPWKGRGGGAPNGGNPNSNGGFNSNGGGGGGGGGRQGGGRRERRRQGPIHGLVGMAMNAAQANKGPHNDVQGV